VGGGGWGTPYQADDFNLVNRLKSSMGGGGVSSPGLYIHGMFICIER
jgi:hypothetical protein